MCGGDPSVFRVLSSFSHWRGNYLSFKCMQIRLKLKWFSNKYATQSFLKLLLRVYLPLFNNHCGLGKMERR